MTYRTFNQWKKRDRSIIKGERSHARDKNGMPLFSKKQTEKRKPRVQDYDDTRYDKSRSSRSTYTRRGFNNATVDYDHDDPLTYCDPLNGMGS